MKRATSEMIYPLRWPDGQPRRSGYRRKEARFKISLAMARDHLVSELKLLGARYVIISSDLQTRLDGLPYANQRQPADTGVAVYFDYDGESMVFACDKWCKIEHNIRAVGKTIEAIRGIARWGSTDMMKRAVGAFKALPEQPAAEDWRRVLDIKAAYPQLSEVKLQYHKLSRVHHADMGGNEEEMKRINIAWEAAQKELG
jgi:hypothetical protein